ncbi:MAG: response regulator, partial [bacterium]
MNNKLIHILIIEDEPIQSEILHEILALDDYSLSIAEDGFKAIELSKKQFFDILLCDYNLPDMNGLEVIHKILELSPESTPILITGLSSVEIAIKGLRAGIHDYLIKPVEPNELKKTICNIIEEREKFKNHKEKFQKLILEKETDSLEIQNEQKVLSEENISKKNLPENDFIIDNFENNLKKNQEDETPEKNILPKDSTKTVTPEKGNKKKSSKKNITLKKNSKIKIGKNNDLTETIIKEKITPDDSTQEITISKNTSSNNTAKNDIIKKNINQENNFTENAGNEVISNKNTINNNLDNIPEIKKTNIYSTLNKILKFKKHFLIIIVLPLIFFQFFFYRGKLKNIFKYFSAPETKKIIKIPLKITSNQSGATIYIDGQKSPEKTPLITYVTIEKHTIKLELNGFPDLGNIKEEETYGKCNLDFSKNEQNGIDKRHWIIKPMDTVNGYEIKGLFWQEVDIKSTDPNTAVIVDEIFVGTAPIKVRLNLGIHIIKMKKAGSEENVQIINVPTDKKVIGYSKNK